MAARPDPADKAFLERFEVKERSTVSNVFLKAVREGVTGVSNVVAVVTDDFARRRQQAWSYGDTARAFRMQEWTALLTEHRAEALAYAGYCLAYEALPREEQLKIKAAVTKAAMPGWRDAPATEKQLALLLAKGWAGDLATVTKGEASDAINILLAGAVR